jgi:mannose-1-phosphate guanylyltransferase
MRAIILSGGVGSRLWPVSSEVRPKPFIKMEDGQSLLQKAFLRAVNLDNVTEIITVANRNFLSSIKNEYAQIDDSLGRNSADLSFILEPFGKNTAAAIASAALLVKESYGPDEVMLVLPADHLVADQEAFREAVKKAKILALDGKIVTFGVKPDNPVVSYGYIECEGSTVKRFIEKPNLELAEEYVKKEEFLWNSGIFCFTAGSMLCEMDKYSPLILDKVHHAIKQGKRLNETEIELDDIAFSLVPEESIDYAVMEKSKALAVVSCDIGWKDIGTWESLSREVSVDSSGNRVKGKATLYNVSDCYIENNGQLMGIVGVKNLAIIGTKNGVLVTNKQNSDEVRNIYSQIRDNVCEEKIFSWGKIKCIQESHDIKIDQIEVKPRASIDLAKDFKYSANWMVVKGVALFSVDGLIFKVAARESKHVTITDSVFLTNVRNEYLVVVTVRLSEHLLRNYQTFSEENKRVSNE